MHLHSRVAASFRDQKRSNTLFDLSLKALKSRLETEIYPYLSESPFIEALKGFPVEVNGDMCWDGRTDMLDYLIKLGPKDITDIEIALRKFKGTC